MNARGPLAAEKARLAAYAAEAADDAPATTQPPARPAEPRLAPELLAEESWARLRIGPRKNRWP